MKTYKHLYPQVVALENLQRACTRASKGKRRYPYADRFAFGLERELFQLQRELQEKTYQPGPYHNFYITEPKRRLVGPWSKVVVGQLPPFSLTMLPLDHY